MDTPASLLERLRRPDAADAWDRFVRLYTPLLCSWAHRAGLQEQDAADLIQDVFTLLVQKIHEFVYDPSKSFRSWLRTVTLNKLREQQRRRRRANGAGREEAQGPQHLEAVVATTPDPAEAFWEAEYRQHLVGQALKLMQAHFQPTSWKACWEHVVAGRPAAEVAAELGITPGAVRAAQFRVLCRLRQELAGLLD